MAFDLTAALEELIAAVVSSSPQLGHVDPSRLLVSLSSTRSGGIGGAWARIHPLRFAGGSPVGSVRRGRKVYRVEMPHMVHDGREILYLIFFLVPRFLDLSLRDKMITVCHELLHISPAFDGDIRRFPGRTYAHGHSRKKFDEKAAALADAFLSLPRAGELTAFLDGGAAELRRRHGTIVGRRVPRPRLRVTGPER